MDYSGSKNETSQHKMAILNIYKPIGWTPLQTLEKLRVEHPEYKESRMLYAGRLDPLAEGVLVVLTDNDRYKREDFLFSNKNYRATFLFGFQSDTYDALGIAKRGSDVDQSQIEQALLDLEKTHELPYPAYSSYKINGKPLLWWARNNRLHEIEIPHKTMAVFSTNGIEINSQTSQETLAHITKNIETINGDFRQEEILSKWNELLNDDKEMITASISLHVSSGTYIRSLAHLIGQQLGCSALLLDLKRTKVGERSIEDSINLLK